MEKETSERIEKYILGLLSPEERVEFEQQINSNPILLQEIEIQKLIFAGLNEIALERQKNRFRQLEYSIRSNQKQRTKNYLKISLTIISLLIGIILFLNFRKHILTQNKGNPDQIKPIDTLEIQEYAANSQNNSGPYSFDSVYDYSNDGRIMGYSNEYKKLLVENKALKTEINKLNRKINLNISEGAKSENKNALLALAMAPEHTVTIRGDNEMGGKYKDYFESAVEKNYDLSIKLLKNIDPSDVTGQRLVLYELPYALFYNKDFGEAVYAFRELQKIDRVDADKIQFFIVLCYFGDERIDFALKELNEILNKSNHLYRDKAIELKNKISGFNK